MQHDSQRIITSNSSGCGLGAPRFALAYFELCAGSFGRPGEETNFTLQRNPGLSVVTGTGSGDMQSTADAQRLAAGYEIV